MPLTCQLTRGGEVDGVAGEWRSGEEELGQGHVHGHGHGLKLELELNLKMGLGASSDATSAADAGAESSTLPHISHFHN